MRRQRLVRMCSTARSRQGFRGLWSGHVTYAAWMLPGCYLEAVWMLPGCCLDTDWTLPGFCLYVNCRCAVLLRAAAPGELRRQVVQVRHHQLQVLLKQVIVHRIMCLLLPLPPFICCSWSCCQCKQYLSSWSVTHTLPVTPLATSSFRGAVGERIMQPLVKHLEAIGATLLGGRKVVEVIPQGGENGTHRWVSIGARVGQH